MVTKKDFKAVAEIIKDNQPHNPDQNGYCKGKQAALGYVARELADYFATQNPNFDWKRFIGACRL
ncbi:hypothetical protein LCGC14_1567010 [marine sediment metagenome]|uniref:Uncharacterized protein n=1 Tax=marine sediment metagenome TaxID=412755 RepID=A0A0F9IKQ3_9ZZZZ